MNFFSRRSERKKQRKHIEHAVFQVKYARRMREDQLDEPTLTQLREFQRDLKDHLRARTYEEGVQLAEKALKRAKQIHPAPRNAYGLRENVEVFVVVIAVALGFRTYFFQPYQIPTGSMQPTLYGITAQAEYEPDWTDKIPFRYVKFALTGSRYREIRAKADGLMPVQNWGQSDNFLLLTIGGKRHKIHKDMLLQSGSAENPLREGALYPWVPRPGTVVKKGDLLARGLQKQGDHIVVNRFITNFKRPDRGDIVVFHTAGLPYPVRENSAYIKRCTGLPGEAISIRNGKLFADGKVVDSPEVFQRQYENPRYPGYKNPTLKNYHDNGELPPILARPDQTLQLGEDEFLMMGDNTLSSLDGRYFGGVDADNIMGLGFFVPWPFFNRGIYNDPAGVVK
jgi:signal peptidase I